MLLVWSLVFLLVALLAGMLGFGGLAAGLAWLAKVLFYVFLALAILSFVANLFRPSRTWL